MLANKHGESFLLLCHHGSDLFWFSLMVKVIQLLLVCYMNRFPHKAKKTSCWFFEGLQPLNSTLSHPHNPNGCSTKDSCSILFSCSPLPLIYTTIGPSEGAFSVLHVTFLDSIIGMVLWMIWCWSSQIKRNNMNAMIVTVIRKMETVYDWYMNHHIYQHQHTRLT